ncbi:MAG TPA: DUF4105 domain-containing protein [Gemmatimonadales bacterium]|nr:DUF4105 domain-containing protein [Gemmatimonadales bacterium]
MIRRTYALLLAGLALGAGRAAAQRAEPPAPPGSQLTVYLMTMGPGSLVWERFGHNAIWIHDPSSPPDQAYNYGLFDFQQQNFLLRFIKGQMWYWMDGFPAESYVGAYRRTNRSVYLQELNLPPAARLELQRFLRWNQEPAHRFYHYDYYRDNCSTRVRDALDRVLVGAIRAQTDSVPAGTTYRFHTQRLTANDPLIFTGLLVALGQGVDRPLSRWEEMFLPMEMREHLRGVSVPGPDGRPAPLVVSERTLFESTATPPPPVPPRWLARYLFLGVILGSAAAWLGGVARRESSGRVAFGLMAGGWELLAGLGGVILAGLWSFTDHVMAYRNENLFQINPLALLLAVLLPFALRGSARIGRLAQALALAVAGLALLGLVLKVLPGFDQANIQVIALALPAHLGVAAGLRRSR